MTKKKIIVVLGPTASGKTALAVQIAQQFNGEVVSADSRQIYREMNIGTNKATLEERQGIKHHLLDIARPDEKITLFDWQKLAFQTIDMILANGKLPILCGGTGLYISSILQNYDPILNKHQECPYEFLVFGLSPERTDLYKKIDRRVLDMVDNGLFDEVKILHGKYPEVDISALSGIGYKEIVDFLEGKISRDDAIKQVQQNSRHYAKRQMTWFRKMEKEGIKIEWNKEIQTIKDEISTFLNMDTK